MPTEEQAEEQVERDAVFTLLAVAAVHATWDAHPLGEGSGHNIGAILVDAEGHPVRFARNEATGRRDLTEHAELRLVRAHIAASSDRTELHKHSVYSTLEPCAMCAGAMAMTNVRRAVHALPDPLYGGVFARLEGYPKQVENAAAPESSVAPILHAFAKSGCTEAIHWLPRDDARAAFAECADTFASFAPKYEANSSLLAEARAFLAGRVSV